MTIHPDNTSSADTPPAVYVDKLSFRYRSPDDVPEPGRKTATPDPEPPDQPLAIEDISFSLPAGELMLIADPRGCGKSTILKCPNENIYPN